MVKVLALLLGCFALASSTKQRRILNGMPVSQESFEKWYNFVVFVGIPCGKFSCIKCTGSLVKPDKVLLSAHCLCSNEQLVSPDTKIYVYVNSTVIGAGRLVFAKVHRRQEYRCQKPFADFQANKDVATLILDEPVHGLKEVGINCDGGVPEDRTRVKMLGFGYDDDNKRHSLRAAGVLLRKCDPRNKYPSVKGIYCVDINGENWRRPTPNSGDSGGPLLVQHPGGGHTLVGVIFGILDLVSISCDKFGHKHENSDQVSAYVNISSHCNFLFGTPTDENEVVG